MQLNEIIEEINKAKDIKEFATNYLLKLADYGDGRYILNYSEQELDTPKNWVSHYCRGLTLAGEPGNYKVIAKSFNRFFNVGEKPEYLGKDDDIDFSKPFEVQFKWDGSLALIYKHNGKVCMNTRGSFADGMVSPLYSKSWKELFDEATKTDLSKTFNIFKGVTYIYELCSPYNQVVDYYDKPFATILAAIYTTGEEIPNMYEGQTYNCKSFEEVQELLKTLKPTQEGFVIALFVISGIIILAVWAYGKDWEDKYSKYR